MDPSLIAALTAAWQDLQASLGAYQNAAAATGAASNSLTAARASVVDAETILAARQQDQAAGRVDLTAKSQVLDDAVAAVVAAAAG
jgi:hypothetical protein